MNNTPIINTLKALSTELSAINNDFCIIGSAALALSGIKTDVQDIDILTTSQNATYLKEKWSAKKQEFYLPEMSNLFRSNFGRFKFQDMAVEVMGDLEVNKNGKWEKLKVSEFQIINLGDFSVKIPTLIEQKRIFQYFGREKDLLKAKLIEKEGIL